MPSIAKTVTAEQLVDLPVPSDLRLAPNGEHVVYCVSPFARKGDNAISSIWIAHVGLEGSARQLTAGIYNDRSPRWSPDGRNIAFLSDRAEAGISCAIYVLSFDGGEPYAITDASNKQSITQIDWSPDGESIAYLSPDELTSEQSDREKTNKDVKVYGEAWPYNRIRLCRLATREVSVVYKRDMHVYRFAWHAHSKSVVMILHSTPDPDSASLPARFRTIVIGSKKSAPLLQFPGRVGESLAWLEDQVYFIGGHTPEAIHSSQKGYIADASTGAWSKYEEEIPSSVHDFRGTSRHIYVRKSEGLATTLHLHGHVIFHTEKEIWAWDAIETAKDETVVAVVLGSTTSPNEVFTLNAGVAADGYARRKEKPTQMSHHSAAIPRDALGTYKPLHCESEDKTTTLDGFFIAPPNSTGEPLPTVVLIHGGPYSRATNAFNVLYHYWYPYIQASGLGYGILCPNYRGGSGRGEHFASQARSKIGTVDYDDVLAVVDEGIKRGLVDKNRMIVGGWSQGGFLSCIAAVRNGRTTQGRSLGWSFKGAMCGAPITCYDMLASTADTPTNEIELVGSAPWATKLQHLRSRKSSPLREIGSARNIPPVLLLHGEADKRVPLAQSVAFHRGLLHRKVPCEFATYSREGHVFQEREHVVDMLERVKRFCDKYLRAGE